MQILGPHPRPTESDTLGAGPGSPLFGSPCRCFWSPEPLDLIILGIPSSPSLLPGGEAHRGTPWALCGHCFSPLRPQGYLPGERRRHGRPLTLHTGPDNWGASRPLQLKTAPRARLGEQRKGPLTQLSSCGE